MPLAVTERAPIFLVRRVGAATSDDFEPMLERLRRMLERSPTKLVAVYDAGEDPNGSPDARCRRTVAQWIDLNESLLREKLAVLEFAAKSPLSRGVLTAIFWAARPPFEIAMHATARGAIADAITRTRADLVVPELLLELDGASRRVR